MKCISPAECSDWLRSRKIAEAPYGKKNSRNIHYKQFAIPELHVFTSALVERISQSKDVLITITDWNFYHPEDEQYYKPHHLKLVEAVRDVETKAEYAKRGLNFLYQNSEKQELITHLDIGLEFGWSVYFYPESTDATLYFWEGALIDIWTDSMQILTDVSQILKASLDK